MSTDCDHKAQRTEHHNFEKLLKFSELQCSAVFNSLQSCSYCRWNTMTNSVLQFTELQC